MSKTKIDKKKAQLKELKADARTLAAEVKNTKADAKPYFDACKAKEKLDAKIAKVSEELSALESASE